MVGPAGEDRGGEAGGAGADDDDICDASILRAVPFEREPLKIGGELAEQFVDRLLPADLFRRRDLFRMLVRSRRFDERRTGNFGDVGRRGQVDLKRLSGPSQHALTRRLLLERFERLGDGRHRFTFSHYVIGVKRDHNVV